jgi:NADH dehydrogenase (ubiquinone) 1 alpha subcomplex subunit 5
VENLTKARLDIVKQNEVTEVIEERIGNGLIEEILIQAGYEFELAQDLANKKVWEELEEKPLEDQWTK